MRVTYNGVINSTDIQQEKTNKTFQGLEFICARIYDLLEKR